jgi:hypothetical protein
MTLAKAKAMTNGNFIVQASLTIVTYNHQNIFAVQAKRYCSAGIMFITVIPYKKL